LLSSTGAAAVTVHGRTMEQRYKKPADWGLVRDTAQSISPFPLIGNGDILTHYEVWYPGCCTQSLEGSGK
jgi:tRNA-dihydrouridine synthase 3